MNIDHTTVYAELPTLARAKFEEDGFLIGPTLVDPQLVHDMIPHMDAVIAGDYETGRAPQMRKWNPGDDESRLRKIDQPQLASRSILELISRPEIGQAAAELTGASWIQVWAVQLLFKPAGGATVGNVGWHQDQQYWLRWWTPDSEVFTCWLAVSDVTPDSGPMRFVPGSHRWGLLPGDFYAEDTDRQREEIDVPDGARWTETSAVLPAGGASFHHRLTYHGSGPNTSAGPRRSFAIHLRTDRSEQTDMTGLSEEERAYMGHIDDPEVCPIIFS
jgi:ectoine hydroxylase-related dioxygenase (phytanoyl-CoA dioxygenase family)